MSYEKQKKKNTSIFVEQDEELQKKNVLDVDEMFELSFVIFHDQTGTYLKKLHDLENQTDSLKNKLSSAHYERIQKNMCKMENSPFYTSLVSELERVADHLVNVGYSIDSPVGDDEFEKANA